MSSVTDILYGFINGYREYAGAYDLDERKEFVERFYVMGENGVYGFRPDSIAQIREWAEECYELGLDMSVPIGKKLMACLLADLDVISIRVAIAEVADEVADDLKVLAEEAHGEVNGHESE